ncbi:NUDIX hydrolase [Pseudemcibacter aquimaris]|uniref:NUDIX hydrolase n=1 Tax=Pseudemcibacter aquimaris TaxID=2857064 RepID=UPI0020119DFA|nr:NUDIX hydrolase [Pseudemcibacter aquimaris]MCC3860881.1 NUDIX hydrolase [Pseudemcibacter aquimaris]WDU59699.1 NUDIX hydrolase [Pseudemcibacter aquimaris]
MAELIDSASILVIRDGDDGLEVLMIKRHQDIAFAGGAYVFPGGKVDPEDIELANNIPEYPDGYSELTHTAFREVFEESGLIIGEQTSASEYRDDLLNDKITFAEIINKANITFNMDALVPFARWVTPRIYPKRFDTRFFLAKAPTGQVATPDGREAVDLKWVKPLEFIEEAREDMMFPTIMNLKLLSQAGNMDEAFEQSRVRKIVTVEPKIIDGKRVIDPNAGYDEVDQDGIHIGVRGD